MKRILLTIISLMLFALSGQAQTQTPARKVENVTLETLTGEQTTLPMWGEKNLLIFYVDPDHPNQNMDFADEMEENHLAAGENIYGFGIMNLKDAPLIPNLLACKIANNRTKKNGATILADKGNILSEAWGLGECNNYFILLLVSKEGELVYVHKGKHTEADKEEFYRIINPYR